MNTQKDIDTRTRKERFLDALHGKERWYHGVVAWVVYWFLGTIIVGTVVHLASGGSDDASNTAGSIWFWVAIATSFPFFIANQFKQYKERKAA